MITRLVSRRPALAVLVNGGFAVALVILLVVDGFALHTARALAASAEAALHTNETLWAISELHSSLKDAETAGRGYAITGNEAFLDPWRTAVSEVPQRAARMKQTISDEAGQQQRAAALDAATKEKLHWVGQVIELRKTKGMAVASAQIATGRGRMLMERVRALRSELEAAETAILNARKREAAEGALLTQRVITFGSALAMALLGAATILVNLEMVRRHRAQTALHALNADLEKRVAERTAELATANRELEAFSYSVSHDLRAPLRGIDGWSLAVLQDYGAVLEPAGKESLQRVRAEAVRMGRMIDDLLHLSKLNRQELRPRRIDLSSMADLIVRRLREQDPDRAVEVVIAPGVEGWGDPGLLQIALENLLGNAWKYTQRTERPRIAFGATNAHYFVRDNGAGFDMQYAGKLFAPFQRMHGLSEFPGSGIGLATVRRVIQRHGGTIDADAAPGQGATFRFTLEEPQ